MKRQALIIGINRYPSLRDKPTDEAKHLHAPYHDAIAIGEMLDRPQENPDFAWCVERLLSNDDNETRKVVSANELRDAIRNLFLPNTQTPPEVALLFFAGHGLRDNNGKVYLAHSNVKPRTGEWGFPLDELREWMQESKIPHQIVFLDCCHSGDLVQGMANLTAAEVQQWNLGGSRFIVAACRDDLEAKGVGKRGVLTEELIKGLDPKNQPANQWVTTYSLYDFLDRQIANNSLLREQIPLLYPPAQSIKFWLGTNTDTNLPTSTPEWWQSLCQQRLEQQHAISSKFITGIAPKIEDVYVPLGLVERKEKSRKKEGDESDAAQGSAYYEETEITRQFQHDEFLENVLRRGDSPKSKGKRLVILGEPGAGKTTLLQQVSRWVAAEIEDAVVLWVSLADLAGRNLDDYLLEIWLRDTVRMAEKASVTETDKNDFVGQFHQGRVWLFLDGADEMAASNPLFEIDKQIRNSGLLHKARILLTCRLNLWDAGSNPLAEFDVYRTLDFDYPVQVEQFINSWFTALGKTDAPAIARGQQLCTALKEPGKERIQDLVKNPLRLTLLCFTWKERDGKLPDTKAGIYQKFVEQFYEWKENQFPLSDEKQQELNKALGELAREAIDKESTRFRLRHKFVSKFLGSRKDKGSLFDWGLKVGWLNQVGVDADNPDEPVYAFYHASFQEYFAAISIDDWDFFLPRDHVDKPIEDKEIPGKYKLYRIFEPQWKEVILLWFEQPKEWLKQQKEELIKRLVEFKDGCGEFFYYQAYFRSSIAISKNISTRLSKVIIEQIIQWSFGYFSEEKQTWMVFWEPIKESAKVVFNEINLPILIYTIAQFKDSNKKYDIMEVIRNIMWQKSFHSQQLCLAALSPVIESVGDDKKKAILDILWSQFPNERLALAAFIESAGINYIFPEEKMDVPKDIEKK